MLTKVDRASDPCCDEQYPDEDINTIEDLLKLDEKYGDHGFIIYFCRDEKHNVTNMHAIVYDDYIE